MSLTVLIFHAYPSPFMPNMEIYVSLRNLHSHNWEKEKAKFHLELHEVTKKFTSSLSHKNFQRWIDKAFLPKTKDHITLRTRGWKYGPGKMGHQSPPPKITRPGKLGRIMG